MIQALYPVLHLFNTVLPSAAAFMVFSAFLMALPAQSGNKAKPQLRPAAALIPMKLNALKLRRVTPVGEVKTYIIPTSMRSRPRSY